MGKLGRCYGLVAVLLVAGVRTTLATDYWVKNGGNDNFNGMSVANAWASLVHAANVVGPGDNVHVLDGSYQGFYLETSGTAANPISFIAEGSNVQITQDNDTTPDGINLEGASYVIVDGFIVNNRTRTGIRTVVNQGVVIRNCTLGNNGRWGILSGFSNNLTIENNVAHHSQIEHGIYVSNSGDNPVIRNNGVYSNHANGIHMNGDKSEGGDGQITGALVEGNVIYDNGVAGGSGINMDGVSNSIVRNNLLYDNHASGISLYRIDGAAGSANNLVVNNTIINASNGRWCVNISGASIGNVVLNNILFTYHSFRGVISIDSSSRPGFLSDYNSVMDRFSTDQGNTVIDLSAWQGFGYDLHSFFATPVDLFLMPGSDFHLLESSPAIDTGTSTSAPTNDIENGPRPVGSGFDVGAYESQLALCNDGNQDPGEQCGEPGLGCSDACTSCHQCICVQNPAVCGDSLVCGSEQCESDGDCTSGQVCNGCACENPAVCTSGRVLEKARVRMTLNRFASRLSGETVLPKPWQAVDPLVNGIRIVVDSATGGGGLDVTLPGGVRVNGVGWVRSSSGLVWSYRDAAGTHGGIVSASVRDRSKVEDGRLRIVARGKQASFSLPNSNAVRSSAVLGTSTECASFTFAAPGNPRPRCDSNGARLSCR